MDVNIIAVTHTVPRNMTWFSYSILIIIFFYPIWIVISLNAFWITPLKSAFVFHNNAVPDSGDTSGQIAVLLFGSHLFRITGANYLYGKRIKAQQLIATADPIFRYFLWLVLFGLELGWSFFGFPSLPLGSETSWGKWETAGIGTVGKGWTVYKAGFLMVTLFPVSHSHRDAKCTFSFYLMLWLQFSFQMYSFKSDFLCQILFPFSALVSKLTPDILSQFSCLHDSFSDRIQQQDLSCAMCSSRVFKLIFLWARPGVGLLWCSHQRGGRHGTNTLRLNILLAFSYFLKHVKFYKDFYD